MHQIAARVFSFASGNRVTVNDDRWSGIQCYIFEKILLKTYHSFCSNDPKSQHASYDQISVVASTLRDYRFSALFFLDVLRQTHNRIIIGIEMLAMRDLLSITVC